MHTCVYVGMHVCIHLQVLRGGFLGGSEGKNLPVMQETRVWSLSQEDQETVTVYLLSWMIGTFSQKQGKITAAVSAQVDKPLHFQ